MAGAMGFGSLAWAIISLGMSVESICIFQGMYYKGLMLRSPSSDEYNVGRVATSWDSLTQNENGGEIDIRVFNAKKDLVSKPVTDKQVDDGKASPIFLYK